MQVNSSTTAPNNQGRFVLIGRICNEEFEARTAVHEQPNCDDENYIPYGKDMHPKLLSYRAGEVAVARRPQFSSAIGSMIPIFTSWNGVFVPKTFMRELLLRGEAMTTDERALAVLKRMYYAVGIVGVNTDYNPAHSQTVTQPSIDVRGIREVTNLTGETWCYGDMLEFDLPNEDERNRTNLRGLDRRKHISVLRRVDMLKVRPNLKMVVANLGLNDPKELEKPYPRQNPRAALIANTANSSQSNDGQFGDGFLDVDATTDATRNFIALVSLQSTRVFIELLRKQADPAQLIALDALLTHFDLEKFAGLESVDPNADAVRYTLHAQGCSNLKKTAWAADKVWAHRAVQNLCMGVGTNETYPKGRNYYSKVFQKSGVAVLFESIKHAMSQHRETIMGMCVRGAEPDGGKGDLILQKPATL